MIALSSVLVSLLLVQALGSDDRAGDSIPRGAVRAQVASALDSKRDLRSSALQPSPDGSCFGFQYAGDAAARAAMAAAVYIRFPSHGSDALPRGSGFLVQGSDGPEGRERIVTAVHVLASDYTLEIVAPDGTALGRARPVAVSRADDVAVLAFVDPDPNPNRRFVSRGIPLRVPPDAARVGSYTLGESTGVDVLASGSALVDRATGHAVGVVLVGANLLPTTMLRVGSIAGTASDGSFASAGVRLPRGGLFWAEGIPRALLPYLGEAGERALRDPLPALDGTPVEGVVAGFPRLACMVMTARGQWMRAPMPGPKPVD